MDPEKEMTQQPAEDQQEGVSPEQGEQDVQQEQAGQTEQDTPQAEQAQDPAEQLKKELAEQKDKYLRLMAEYDNYRKRTAKQQLEIRDSAIGDTVLSILSVYDNFERAVNTESSDEKYKSGVEMIFKQFTAALEKLKVTLCDPTGEPFDPSTANAVSTIEDPELGDNVVAQVFEKGVKIGDKVLRYPTVVVANP